MSEPIEIIVRKGQMAEGTAPTPSEEAPRSEQGKTSVQQKAVNAALINAGKQAIIKGVKMSADLSGDYTISNAVEQGLSLVGDVAMIVAAGPVGAIAVAGRHTLGIVGSFVEQEKAIRKYDMIMQRSGNLALKGSRYTDD